MKHSVVFTVVFVLAASIFISSCKEDEYADYKIKNELWLKNFQLAHQNNPAFHTTASGLTYEVIHQGWTFTRRPTKTSNVIVSYKGMLIDGSTFGSGIQDTLYLGSTIPAWQEGICKMNSGGTYRFYVPCELGYKSSNLNQSIPPYSTLIFEVDLHDSQENQ